MLKVSQQIDIKAKNEQESYGSKFSLVVVDRLQNSGKGTLTYTSDKVQILTTPYSGNTKGNWEKKKS